MTSSRPFHRTLRDEALYRGGSSRYDLLVVGGGITGVAVARDASQRGLKVALVEQDDLGAGTSSRSSKLVHGGLRYLEHLELKLVFEATAERAVLLKLAPHLVRPLPFLFPVYRGDKEGLALINAGMWLYDALSLFRAPRMHRTFSPGPTLDREPLLAQKGLTGSGVYYDAGTDDTRLTLATGLSAWEHGTDVFTACRVVGWERNQGGICGAEVEDRLTGRTVHLGARAVVNATGPWSDRTRHLGGRQATSLLRPTKGVHLVLPWGRLPVRHTVVLRGPADQRVMFAIPWGLHTYVGTTDTDFDGDPSRVHATPEDANYLLQVLNHYFPTTAITPSDFVSSWAGLRPLVREDEVSESDVSREHKLIVEEDGLITIAGGKLTTHRRMAMQVMEAVAQVLGGSARTPCRTDQEPLPGGSPLPEDEEARELTRALPERVAEQLADVYGSRWVAVGKRAAEQPALARPLCPGLPYIRAEVDHAVEEEGALSVTDVLARRTQILLRDPQQGLEIAPAVADRMASLLGWSEDERERSLAAYTSVAVDAVRFRNSPAPSRDEAPVRSVAS